MQSWVNSIYISDITKINKDLEYLSTSIVSLDKIDGLFHENVVMTFNTTEMFCQDLTINS